METFSALKQLESARARGRPLVLAHRGGRHLWPENTLKAFSSCFGAGAEGVELDVRCSRDGKVIVFHDAELERLTDGQGRVASTPWETLRRLHVKDHQGRLSGETIPDFESVLATLPVDKFLNVEIKFEKGSYEGEASLPLVRAVLKVLRKEPGYGKRPVIISSFSLKVNLQLLLLAGDFARGYLFEEKWGKPAIRRMGEFVLQPHALHPGVNLATDELCRAALSRGREVAVWTVNDPEEMRALAARGVGALITDRPDLCRQAVDALSGASA